MGTTIRVVCSSIKYGESVTDESHLMEIISETNASGIRGVIKGVCWGLFVGVCEVTGGITKGCDSDISHKYEGSHHNLFNSIIARCMDNIWVFFMLHSYNITKKILVWLLKPRWMF